MTAQCVTANSKLFPNAGLAEGARRLGMEKGRLGMEKERLGMEKREAGDGGEMALLAFEP